MNDPAGRFDLLVVDDHPEFARSLSRWLEAEAPEWTLSAAFGAEEGLASMVACRHDVVLLDVKLGPGLSGIEICREARAAGVTAPILMLTAAEAVSDRLSAFEAGADEYIVKGSMSSRELIHRIQTAVGRRRRSSTPPSSEPVMSIGPIAINLRSHGVVVGDRAIELPKQQRRLLVRLAQELGDTVSQEELCRAAGITPGACYKNLHNEILRLRQILGKQAAQYVRTVRGEGYRLGQ